MKKTTLLMVLLGCLFSQIALAMPLFPDSELAHSGRTDKYGCHNDRINGGRHCH